MRALAVTAALAFAAPAFADAPPPSGDQQRAAKLFEEGRALLTAHDPAGACKKFDEAIALDPLAPGTMLNLGLCNEELGKFKTALYWFRKAEHRATEVDPPLPDHEKAAKEHAAKLANEVATVVIVLAHDAPGALVKIDGEIIKPDDFHAVEVDPGHHVLGAAAVGMKNIRQEFDVTGRGGQTLALSFVAGDNAIIVDRGQPRRRLGIEIGIGGSVALVAGAGVAVYAYSQYHNHRDNYQKTGNMTERIDANNDASLARYWGTALVGGGLAAMAAAAFIYYTAPQKERVDQTVFAPIVTPSQVGFALTRSF
ncbi:MAG TPA: hypothetical protein VMJ10_18125 [Kofleriaceae bacterium]|nr:hypothetical protein [Kofleriaceae bacterium]